MTSRHFKDHIREHRIFVSRAIIAFLFVLVLTGCLVARFYYLQVIQHDTYTTLSDRNRVQLLSLPPPRGLIFDRNGELLADNRPSFSLTLVKERVPDMAATVEQLREILDLTDEEVERFYKRQQQRQRPYQPVAIKLRLSEEEIARFSINRHRFPGVEVEAEAIRYYPMGETMAHVLGYVGRINEAELKVLDPVNYSGTNYTGKLGIEKVYEEILHGKVGYQKVETNARGRVLRVLERIPPETGKNISLHIDSRLQKMTENALAGYRAAAVVIDVKTGGILAMVSTPSYDPNLFVTGIDQATYEALRDSPDIPLYNRAIRGRYPPASTIKPFVGLAGLNSDKTTWSHSVWDPGYYQIGGQGRRYRDWKRWGHGWVDLHYSIVQSCDVYFYDLAYRMGPDPMADMLSKFGFGRVVAHDALGARAGILPSREWKQAALRQPWYPGDSLNISIGQGYMLSTPLQLATATAVLANRGKWVTPRLIMEIEGQELPPIETPPDIVLNNPQDWDRMFKAMRDVMHSTKGTGRSAGKDAPYEIAGKTGTAQVVGIAQNEEWDASKVQERHQDHALFIGFAPVEEPRIAVAVVVENGIGGGSTAAPIARKIFDAYLLDQYEEPASEESSTKNAVTAAGR